MAMLKMIALALAALGALLMLLGSFLLLRKLAFSRRAQRATGVVTHCERVLSSTSVIDSSSTPVYRPTVRFQRADGSIVDHTPTIATNTMNYPVGASITVLYDPNSPGQVMLGAPNSFRFWLGAIVCLLTGAVFTGVGALMFLIGNGQGEEILRFLL